MTRVIAVASQKGGVGKTTTAVNLAFFLHLAGHRTLLVDLDPQANATSGLGGEPARETPLRPLTQDPSSWRAVMLPTAYDGLLLVPSGLNQDYAPLVDSLDPGRIRALRDALLALDPAMDYVVLDCPPATGPIPRFALQLSDSVLIPVQCEYYAMEGLSQMLPTVEKVRAGLNRPLELEGILLTMFDERLELAQEVRREVRQYFPDDTLETVIPRDVALAESASFGKPIFVYGLRSRGCWSYLTLTKEILDG